ncbi:hypothetical protein Csal_0242 [Chromohalobacter israelensis DSM 3043]|uniref:Uncharacterized protein n=1 Tax=Chromohalobacter israelensis (strain ATCC BAA-138 / DSM 3043 / CIP 106854 / NCIMB 13768 / 1H11) TaxID=290398 RepID=Q1R102_CHRI1|nr:hypothetical protein Csal_0242 [Chromohalobacter salexigens DSM 3043]
MRSPIAPKWCIGQQVCTFMMLMWCPCTFMWRGGRYPGAEPCTTLVDFLSLDHALSVFAPKCINGWHSFCIAKRKRIPVGSRRRACYKRR